MMIFTRAANFPLTPAIRRRVESRILSASQRLGDRVLIVTALLEDADADRGAIDRWCRLTAAVRKAGVVIVEARDVDLYAAVDRAVEHLRRAVLETTRRQAARDRRGRRPGLGRPRPGRVPRPPVMTAKAVEAPAAGDLPKLAA